MSEEASAEQNAPTPEPASTSADEMYQLWLKSAGWLVMAFGALDIILALRMREYYDTPFLTIVGYILMGVAVVLAGQALSEGWAWSLPLCALAFFPGFMTPFVGFVVYSISKPVVERGYLRIGATKEAQLPHALWIAGFLCWAAGFLFWRG